MKRVHKTARMAWCLLLAMLLCFQGLIPATAPGVDRQPVPAGLTYAIAEEPSAEPPASSGTNELDGSKIEGIQVRWVTQDSQTNNDGEAVSQEELDDISHLYLATTSSAPLSMIYKVEVEFSGQYDYGPGDITITIPAQVWYGRRYEETGMEGETVGVVDESKLIGTLELPLPAAPSTKADFNWQIIDGNYVLTNTRTVGATSSVSIEVAIRNVSPVSVVDMSHSAPITAHCEVVTNQGNTIELTSLPIDAQIDTQARITSAYKNGEVFEDYPGGLSEEMLARLPEGTSPEDYIFVRWYTYHSHVNNQPFSLDIGDVLSDAYELVPGAGGKSSRQKVTDGIFLGLTNYQESAPEAGTYQGEFDQETLDCTAEIVDHETTATTGTQYSHTAYMWSAYRKDAFYVPRANEPQRVYYFENDVEWILTETDKAVEADRWNKPEDPQKVTTARDGVVVPYSPVRFARPTGEYAVNKWTEQVGYKDWTYGYALNKLESKQPVDMTFVVETIGYGYPWTSPRTMGYTNDELTGKVANSELDALELTEADFGLLGWKQITHDFQTFFNYETTPLTSGDFEMKGLRVSTPGKMRYAKRANGTWGYQTDSTLPTPDLVIEYQLNNEDTWYKAATATWGEDGLGAFRFTDVSADCTTSGMTVYFPENATDVRHTFVSNVFGGQTAEKCDIAAIDWYVYPLITMKPSDRACQIVRELFEQSENPTTKFKNDVIMDTYGWVEENGEGTLVLDDDFDSSLATYAGASYGVSLNKSGSYETDVENQRLLIHYTATLTEQSNLKVRADYDAAVEEGVIPAETSGVWYDLLPPRVVPLLDTIRLRSGDTISNIYTIENYNDTGRILLVVEAELTPKPSHTNSLGYSDQPTLSFTAAYTWLDMDEYGKNLVNYVAFESTVDNLRDGTLGTIRNQKGEPDDPLAGNNATTPTMPADIAAAMTGLDPNTRPGENRFVYGKCSNNVSALIYAVSGLEKAVKNDLVGIWTQGLDGQEQVTVYEGLGYSYRLRVSSAENTSTKGIIIYDTIENYIIPDPSADEDADATKAADFEHTQERKEWTGDWQGKGQWRGTLNKVDLSEFVNAGVAPVLLYSQLPGLQFADTSSGATDDNFDEDTELFASGAYDISNRQIWQVAELDEEGVWTVPAGLNVSAIAIDATTCTDGSEFVLKPEETIAGYLRMAAPDDNGDPDAWHAKGAYARTESGEVDWEAAMDPANNMYAYNNARVRLIQGQTSVNGTNWLSSYRMIRNDYTRVGILPGVIKLEKVWQDQNNHDAVRPDSVTVAVKRRVAGLAGEEQPVPDADGLPITAVLDESNNWSAQFNQMDIVNEQGLRYLYTFAEQPVEGYESKVEFIDLNHYRLINVHPNEQTVISGEKLWNDEDDAYGARPRSITLKLYRDDEYVTSKVVTADADGKWSYTFGKLDKYADGGKEYAYRVEEEYVPKYAGEAEGYALVNNTYQPFGDLEVLKTVLNATPSAAEKAFTFTLVLLQEQTDPDEPAAPLMDKYQYALWQQKDGEWEQIGEGRIGNGETFQLKGDQKITVYDLPSESAYQVIETEAAGFTVTSVDAEGTIRAGQTAQAEFTNTYSASGNAQLKVDKDLSGRQIRKNQFRFELIDNNPDSPTYGQAIRTARVNAPETTTGGNGVEEIFSAAGAVFGQLDYTHEDAGKSFQYIVKEVDMGADGYGYDAKKYDVTVTVADENGDGSLTVTHNFMETPISFENAYTAEGEVVLRAWKTLEGRQLKAGEFTFELFPYDADKNEITGECIGTATNDAEGNVVFDALSFDQDDVSLSDDEPATYTYLMREQQGQDKTVVYSDQAYIVTIKVYDNGDGTLSFVQDQQTGVRTYVECPDCEGSAGDLSNIDPAGKGVDFMHYYSDTGSSHHYTGSAIRQVVLCSVCHGLVYIQGEMCETCKGSGLELHSKYITSGGNYYIYEEYVQFRPSEERWYAKGVGSGGTWYYQTIPERLEQFFPQCDTCNNTGEIEGPLSVTGETTMPVFENTLKPGSLSITKEVEGANPNTAQTFRFHVKFTGEKVPDEVKLDLKEMEDREPAEAAKYLWWQGEPDSVKEVYRAKPEELVGDAYAVYNSAEKEVIFFRAEKDENGYAIDPYGNMFKVPERSSGRSYTDQNGMRYTVYFEDLEDPRYEYDLYWRNSTVETVWMRDPIKPKSLKYWFRGMYGVKNFDISKLDTSEVTDFSYAFYYSLIRAFETIDLTHLDTSSATNYSMMFYYPSIRYARTKNLNVANLDFTNVDIDNTQHLYGDERSDYGTVERLTINDTFKVKYDKAWYGPNTNSYTGIGDNNGKWRNVETGQVLEGQALFEEGGHAGTWIWDKYDYDVTFVANGGAGTMPNALVLAGEAYTFYPTFYRYGYRLTGFNGSFTNFGQKFVPINEDGSVTIPANNLRVRNGAGTQTATLTAKWEKIPTALEVAENSVTFTLLAGETITFNDLPAGTAYEVWEETPAGWTLVRKVDDSGVIQPMETAGAVFTNSYTPTKAVAALRASKTYDGLVPAEGAFSFTLAGEGVSETVTNNAAGAVEFTPIEYGAEDIGKTFTYTITENPGNDGTIAYDETVYTVTVAVKDNGQGVLSATVTYPGGKPPVFRNTTKPGSLTIRKTTESATEAAAGQQFTVEVRFADKIGLPWSGTVTLDDQQIAITDGLYSAEMGNGGELRFTDIPAGVRYEVSEPDPLPGWIMDRPKTGVIESTLESKAELINTYTVKGVAAPQIHKALAGRALAEDEFSFRLLDAEHAVVGTAANAADGSVVFPDITYTEAGIYEYVVEEVPGDDETVVYSGQRVYVTIAMEDKDGKGRLTPTITYATGEEDGSITQDANTITNKIKPGSLSVSKTVVSSNPAHAAQAFTFSLLLTDAVGQPVSGDFVIEKSGATESLIMVDGQATFTLKGGETALISGLPHGAGYAVTEAAAGGFTQKQTGASGSIVVNQTASASFTNTYAAAGEYAPVAEKSLTGKELEADAFIFALMDEEGYELAIARNGADGSVAFPPIAFTEADVGTRVYHLAEKDAGAAGVTYDAAIRTITLTITDNGDGTLTVTDDLNGQPVLFANSYSETISHSVTKMWQDEEDALGLRPESITVELYRNKVKYSEASLTAEEGWAYTFTGLPAFDEQGVKYTYEVREVPVPGYTTGVNTQGNATTLTNTPLGVMEVTKTVAGGDKEKAFAFTVTLTAGDVPVTGGFAAMGPGGETVAAFDEDGTTTFRLRHGETMRITGLPVGAGYTVTEAADEDYTGEITEGSATGVIQRNSPNRTGFTNTAKPTVFQVTKVWEGGSGPIELTLYANGVKLDPQPAYTRTEDVYTYENLPKYDEQNEPIVYSAKEKYFDGYVTIYDNVAPYAGVTNAVHDGGTIINRKEQEADFKVLKRWQGLADGEETPAITLTLYCNGDKLDTPTPRVSGGWYKYYDLPETYNGQPAVYTVVEEPLDGYMTTYQNAAGEETTSADNGGVIINTRIPATGDRQPVGLWMLLMGLSMAALAAIGFKNRKRG
ncbi:MAG: Cna B-type domain-containing protein [Clostridiales bacterium]|nr:Cna B-type domain-containing protein [Clostridiales bacterium]